MKLRNYLISFITIIVCVQVVLTGSSLYLLQNIEVTSIENSQMKDLNRIGELVRSEVIGNIMIGNTELLKSELERLAKEEKIEIALNSKNFNYTNLSGNLESKVVAEFDLIYANENYGRMFFAREKPKVGIYSVKTFSVILVVQVLFVSLLMFLFFNWSKKSIARPLSVFKSILDESSSIEDKAYGDSQWVPLEVNELADSIRKLWEDYREKTQLAAKKEIYDQVAHDIRSPLSALNILATVSKEMPESQRIILRAAVQRINGIANDLLMGSRLPVNSRSHETSIQMLSGVVDLVISEKRLELIERKSAKVTLLNDPIGYGLFSRVNIIGLKSALSNLINNSIEAIEGNGEVKIGVYQSQNNVVISICDNGKGIPRGVLSRLGQKGLTYGKDNLSESGSGIGVYGAKKSIEQWGGRLKFESEIGKGTKVSVSIPQIDPPPWFVDRVEVSPYSKVVIVDDDPNIHLAWKELLKDWAVELIDLYDPSSFRTWVKNNQKQGSLFLCDYEFIGYSEKGIDLVTKLDIRQQSIIVTGRFDDKILVDRCSQEGIKLLPKNLTNFVPIEPFVCQVSRNANENQASL